MTPSERDNQRLVGVNPALVRFYVALCAKLPCAEHPFTVFVIEGCRDLAEEEHNVATGKSQTMDSRHLFGLAIDVGIDLPTGLTWDPRYYKSLDALAMATARDLNMEIEWGGDWHTERDYVHFQLPHSQYPDPAPVKADA